MGQHAQAGMSTALRRRLLDAETERETLRSNRGTGRATAQHAPQDFIGRYKRLTIDLRGALGRDVLRSREILRQLLGDIRLQPEENELYAEFEARPERVFMSERAASNCGCGDPLPELEAQPMQFWLRV
jgi:hypothetical protein